MTTMNRARCSGSAAIVFWAASVALGIGLCAAAVAAAEKKGSQSKEISGLKIEQDVIEGKKAKNVKAKDSSKAKDTKTKGTKAPIESAY